MRIRTAVFTTDCGIAVHSFEHEILFSASYEAKTTAILYLQFFSCLSVHVIENSTR